MDIQFDGKRILITGGGRGIGRQLAKTLSAKSTAKIFVIAQTQENLDTLKQEYPKIETICQNLSDWDGTRSAIKKILPIDVLVNNAAYASLQPCLETTAAEMDRIFNVNVKAMVNVSQVVAQDLKDRKVGGSIVNMSSQASQAALADHLAYCASKGAVDMVTKVMALELGPYNIRVNAVNPTVVLTDMGKLGWADPAKSAPMLAKIPLGRFSEVEEVVNAILFLMSDKASMINGITLPVDGGFLAT